MRDDVDDISDGADFGFVSFIETDLEGVLELHDEGELLHGVELQIPKQICLFLHVGINTQMFFENPSYILENPSALHRYRQCAASAPSSQRMRTESIHALSKLNPIAVHHALCMSGTAKPSTTTAR